MFGFSDRYVDQRFNEAPQFGRGCPSGDDLVVRDAGPTERFFLDGVTGCGSTLMMAAALVLNGMARMTVLVDEEKVDALRVDASVGRWVLAAEDFAERDLGHDLPARIAIEDHPVEFLEDTCLASVKKRLHREFRRHHDAQLICGVRLSWRESIGGRRKGRAGDRRLRSQTVLMPSVPLAPGLPSPVRPHLLKRDPNNDAQQQRSDEYQRFSKSGNGFDSHGAIMTMVRQYKLNRHAQIASSFANYW